MALDFPASATVGQIYTGTNGVLYTFDGIRWRSTAAGETDPIYSTGTASTITGTNISLWNQAYNWGNHATKGYLTSTISSHLLPAANAVYDLGSTSSQWRSLYVSTSTIYIGGTPLTVIDGNLAVGGNSVSLGKFKIHSSVGGSTLGTMDNPDTGGWGGYDIRIDSNGNQGSNASIYIPSVSNQAAGTPLQIFNQGTQTSIIQLFGQGGVQVVTGIGGGEKVFEFTDNGVLILPDTSTIQNSNALWVKADNGTNSAIFKASPTGTGKFAEMTAFETTSSSNNRARVTTRSQQPARVEIGVESGNIGEKVWYFNSGGSITFPDGTDQTSAYPGSTSTLVNGTSTLELLVNAGQPFVVFPSANNTQIQLQGNEINALDTATLVLSAGASGIGSVYITTFNPAPNTWVFGNDSNLTIPGEIYGKQLTGIGGTPNGRAVNITPADDASDKKFKFRVDQYGETFTRAYLDLPSAQNNKQVAISFAHENNTAGYIFNQGADTVDDGLNNAFNIFYNAGDIKLTAMTTGTGVFKTWKFGQSGGLTSPDGTTSTGASVYVPYATSSSFKITTLQQIGPSSYYPYVFEVQGSKIVLPSGNGYIQSGQGGGIWALDSGNLEFTFPNLSRINYGDGGYLSTGTLQVDVRSGGIFQIRLNDSNKTWTFNNSGNIVFPNGTEQATAFTGTNVITGTNDNFVISINTGTLTVRNQFTDSVVISSLGITGAINYIPTNPADWTGSPTVGTVSSAIDELAYRTTTLEAAGGGGGGTSDIADVWMFNSNGNFGVAANSVTIVPFDNTSGTGNVGTDWNTASGFNRLAPTLGGWYDITCHIQWAGSWSANVSLMVYKNGNLYKNIGSSWIGQGGQQYGSCLIYLNGTGDYADIRVNQGSGGFQFIEPGISKTWVQAIWVKG